VVVYLDGVERDELAELTSRRGASPRPCG
jgi:hypothetical protein